MWTLLKSIVILLILDGIYLYFFKGYFERQIVKVQKTAMRINILPTILCYIAIIFVLNYFILNKKLLPSDAFLLGISIYAIYELTNKATLNEWSYVTVIIDTLWGGILFALTTWLVNYGVKYNSYPVGWRAF